jgi:hypothetical protein
MYWSGIPARIGRQQRSGKPNCAAQAIASGNAAQAADGASQLMDYLEQFTRRVIDA